MSSQSKPTKKERSFVIVEIEGVPVDNVGRYTGRAPIQVARKAAKRLFKEGKHGDGSVKFAIRDSTKGYRFRNTIYVYEAAPGQSLDIPKEVQIAGKTVTYHKTPAKVSQLAMIRPPKKLVAKKPKSSGARKKVSKK